MANRTTKVTLSAQVSGYVEGMQKAAQATRETGSETEKLAQQQQAMESMGRTMLVAGGAMAAGLVLSTKAAIDWDTAWAGVTKTVDGSPEQMAALESQLRSLTSILPASHTEIAAVAEAAGQLGIERGNVAAFTRTMIDLGETTNLSSEQAATSLARFTNIMGTSQSEVSNLGSALVDLGNNYATTEAEILEMSMRLAGAGRQIGMSEGEVLGLSTALSSVGIEAEAGGSAMSKVMIDIASSVDKGGERLQMFADIAGVSADDFATKWRDNAGGALALFVSGLANSESQGKSTLGVLEELGITEVRMRDALLRSASASDQFTAAMATGNEAFEENSALAVEAEKRYDTTAAKLQVMGNKVTDAAISLGQHLLPAVEAVADGVGGFADMLSGLDGPMGTAVAWAGLLTAGILLAGGAALTAVPMIARFKVASEILGISVAGATGRLRGMATFMTGPWGVALAVAGASMYTFNKTIEAGIPTQAELKNSLLTSADAADVLADAGKRGGLETALMADGYKKSLSDLGGLFERTGDYANTFWSHAFHGTTNDDIGALDSLDRLGDALAEIAGSDLPAAQEAFKGLADSQDLTSEESSTLLDRMPALKDALTEQATQLGLTADDATLLKIALGEIGPAAEDGTEGAEGQKTALEELQGVASDTSDAVSQLADEILNFGSTTIDAERASLVFEEQLDALKEQVKGGKKGIDESTEAGRANRKSLLDMAEATSKSAAATFEATGNQDEANAVLKRGRSALIEAGRSYGMTKKEAKAYADQILATPKTVSTKANLDTENAKSQFSAWLAQMQGKTVTVIGQMAFKGGVNPSAALNHANGGLHAYANGGIQEFAGGGFPTGIYSGGEPIHKFAEPETGWEAYISGKPSERDRNRQIWVDAGERLGMGAVGGTPNITVYTQNPFTGDYLLSKVDQVANSAIDDFAGQQAQASRKAGY